MWVRTVSAAALTDTFEHSVVGWPDDALFEPLTRLVMGEKVVVAAVGVVDVELVVFAKDVASTKLGRCDCNRTGPANTIQTKYSLRVCDQFDSMSRCTHNVRVVHIERGAILSYFT